MFSKILIANRGEIACRIARTTRRLGIASAAVYSDADRTAMHVALADEAFRIGPAPARASYLDGSKIIDAAQKSGAQAIHPGYGFLSENADFAEACARAGVAFIGPPPAAIRAMGDKAQAKALMEKGGVPLVPGYHGSEQDPDLLAQQALAIGYPVLVKPLAGGGGKGMKIVFHATEFADQLASAKREALSAFGNDRVLIEKYFSHTRHVEVQVFGDARQNFVHLFDRDCSIQRRYQKIIEEAPAPQVPDEVRQAMREAALSGARAIGYIGAGTVEFLLSPDDGAFYFLEMNTRLQVEHPVTEMITGIDLVEWQLHVAAGGALPLRQAEIRARGHAIEARLYAEDPARDFLPQSGRITRLDFPAQGAQVRIDTGVRAGDAIPADYDPMIAKVIVWDKDRRRTLLRLRAALGKTRVAGVATNLDLLCAIAAHQAFTEASPDTGFIGRHADDLLPKVQPAGNDVLAMAVIGLLCERAAFMREKAQRSSDPWSPWTGQNAWRLNEEACETVGLREIVPEAGGTRTVEIRYLRNGWRLDLPGDTFFHASGTLAPDGTLAAGLDGHRVKAVWVHSGEEILVFAGTKAAHRFELAGSVAEAERRDEPPGRLTSPMPGRIAALLVTPGARVAVNQPVLVLEAMKMEHMVRAPKAGILKEFKFQLGDQVGEGVQLATFETGPPPEIAS
ncbi:MAG: acetyl/propionyl/methylcrotonyl-CoA carboxylase subunit alpha [Pseudomonadota bacterium]|nr:acetyl/propionyl/methylcrotonyl-CoA carboxylase subunit alpha [Pseudomonadota bacterium]